MSAIGAAGPDAASDEIYSPDPTDRNPGAPFTMGKKATGHFLRRSWPTCLLATGSSTARPHPFLDSKEFVFSV
jgi:hypothetical protein